MQIAQPSVYTVTIAFAYPDSDECADAVELYEPAGITVFQLLFAAFNSGDENLLVREIYPTGGCFVSPEAQPAMLQAGEKGMCCVRDLQAPVNKEKARIEKVFSDGVGRMQARLDRNKVAMQHAVIETDRMLLARGFDIDTDFEKAQVFVDLNNALDQGKLDAKVEEIREKFDQRIEEIQGAVDEDVEKMLAGFDRDNPLLPGNVTVMADVAENIGLEELRIDDIQVDEIRLGDEEA
jgi:hypothetical protein